MTERPASASRADFKRVADEALSNVKLASDLINELWRGRETAKLYHYEHQQAQVVAEGVLSKIRSLFSNRRIFTIELGLRRFLINQLPMYEVSAAASEMHSAMRDMGIGGVTFIEGVDQRQVYALMSLLSEGISGSMNRSWLEMKFEEQNVDKIVLEKPKTEKWAESPNSAKQGDSAEIQFKQASAVSEFDRPIRDPRNVHQVAVGLIKDVFNTIDSKTRLNLTDVTRISESLAECILQRPDEMTAIAMSGRIDEYTYLHPVNVAVFGALMSLTFQRDLDKLIDLIRIALVYDVGKGEISKDILEKRDPLTETEIEELRKHPLTSADLLDRHMEMEKLAVVVAYEHHTRPDGLGYPHISSQWEPTLVTAIIRTAEAFDSVCANGLAKKTLPPYLAFKKLMGECKDPVEQMLLSQLVQAIGFYPAGTIVTLESKEAGIVLRPTPGEPLAPVVRIMIDHLGRMVDNPKDVQAKGAWEIIDALTIEESPLDPLDYYPFLPLSTS